MQAINSALRLQGLAILWTAIYQMVRQQLTLFHAICVLHLLSLLGFGLVAQRKCEGGCFNRWMVMAILRIAMASAFIALTSYVWLKALTFDSQPECNASTVYVVFGVSIHATNDTFRIFILMVLISMAVGWVFSMVVFTLLAACRCGWLRSTAKIRQELSSDFDIIQTVLRGARFKDAVARRNEAWGQVIELLIHTAINVYMVVTLQQTVSRNHLSHEEEWTFGQVFAIFVLLGVVVVVLNILLSKLDGRAKTAGELEGRQLELLEAPSHDGRAP